MYILLGQTSIFDYRLFSLLNVPGVAILNFMTSYGGSNCLTSELAATVGRLKFQNGRAREI